MHLEIRHGRRWPQWPLWAVGLTSAWLVGVGLIAIGELVTGIEVNLCLFRRLTSLPCPTCGLTRSVMALAAGRPLTALLLNPLMSVALAVCVLMLVVRLASGYYLHFEAGPKSRRLIWVAVVAAVVINWFYLFWRLG